MTDADGVKPTERPWYVGTQNDGFYIIDQPPRPGPLDYINDKLTTRAIANVCEADRRAQADANLIVHCVNLHDELVEALRWYADPENYVRAIDRTTVARAALVKVGK